jgi:hypothetical protein
VTKRPLSSSDDACFSGLAMWSVFRSTCLPVSNEMPRISSSGYPPACQMSPSIESVLRVRYSPWSMTASEVKLYSPILCSTAAATERQNNAVQHLAIEANFHTEFVVIIASLRPSPHHVALLRD